MKILVISDTHNKLNNAVSVIKKIKDKISMVIHLGDNIDDAKTLESNFTDIEFKYVPGNCDFYGEIGSGTGTGSYFDDATKIITINNSRILITHGHKQGVKYGYENLAQIAKDKGVVAALCGHTHSPEIINILGVLIVNPGSISYPRGKTRQSTYAILNIDATGDISASVVPVNRVL